MKHFFSNLFKLIKIPFILSFTNYEFFIDSKTPNVALCIDDRWVRSRRPEVFCKKGVLRNFTKTHRKTPVPASLFTYNSSSGCFWWWHLHLMHIKYNFNIDHEKPVQMFLDLHPRKIPKSYVISNGNEIGIRSLDGLLLSCRKL